MEQVKNLHFYNKNRNSLKEDATNLIENDTYSWLVFGNDIPLTEEQKNLAIKVNGNFMRSFFYHYIKELTEEQILNHIGNEKAREADFMLDLIIKKRKELSEDNDFLKKLKETDEYFSDYLKFKKTL